MCSLRSRSTQKQYEKDGVDYTLPGKLYHRRRRSILKYEFLSTGTVEDWEVLTDGYDHMYMPLMKEKLWYGYLADSVQLTDLEGSEILSWALKNLDMKVLGN